MENTEKNFTEKYFDAIREILSRITAEESTAFDLAAETLARVYANGKKIYIFGCTHSAILAEDVFYRAGAPAFWRPLWGPGMSIAQTPGFLTSAAEHNEQLGADIVNCSRLEAGDALVVLSTSGKNAAPVAVAETALKRGVKVIAVTSGNYRTETGNHSRIANLYALRNELILIDNHVPQGDASVTVCGDTPMAPLSTIAGSFIVHTLSALTVEKLRAAGVEPPVFLSSNAPGGKERNEALLKDPEIRSTFLLP